MENGRICLCKRCIDAIRTRGEPVFVGEEIWNDDEEKLICEWCEDVDEDELYECIFP